MLRQLAKARCGAFLDHVTLDLARPLAASTATRAGCGCLQAQNSRLPSNRPATTWLGPLFHVDFAGCQRHVPFIFFTLRPHGCLILAASSLRPNADAGA